MPRPILLPDFEGRQGQQMLREGTERGHWVAGVVESSLARPGACLSVQFPDRIPGHEVQESGDLPTPIALVSQVQDLRSLEGHVASPCRSIPPCLLLHSSPLCGRSVHRHGQAFGRADRIAADRLGEA